MCFSWESSSTHLTTGPHLCIWFPKRHQGIEDFVEITEPFSNVTMLLIIHYILILVSCDIIKNLSYQSDR